MGWDKVEGVSLTVPCSAHFLLVSWKSTQSSLVPKHSLLVRRVCAFFE